MPEGNFHWTALKLALIISAAFLFQLAFQPNIESLVLKSSEVVYRPWTLVTYIFLHGSFSHLYSNLFALVIFGSILEKVVGYKNFLKVFFVTGIFSGISSTVFYSSVIGASGTVFGIMGALTILRPKMVVWALGVPMYMIIAMIVYASLDLAGMFYPDNIAHAGHLSALALGIVIGLIWKKRYEIVEVKGKKEPVLSEGELRRWEDDYMVGNKG